jgi:hypothetical protein
MGVDAGQGVHGASLPGGWSGALPAPGSSSQILVDLAITQ